MSEDTVEYGEEIIRNLTVNEFEGKVILGSLQLFGNVMKGELSEAIKNADKEAIIELTNMGIVHETLVTKWKNIMELEGWVL